MQISAKRMAALREHIRAESEHDMDTLIAGMTQCYQRRELGPKSTV